MDLLDFFTHYENGTDFSDFNVSFFDDPMSSLMDFCPNLSFWDQTDLHHSDPFKSAMHTLNVYCTPMIILVGIAGNLLSFLVFTQTHLKCQSSSIYLASLAMVDNVFLVSLTFIWLNQMEIRVFHTNGWCQSLVYCTYVTTFLSVWYVVTFTIERFIIVHFPLRKDKYCTPQRAKRVVLTLALFALGLYAFIPFTSGVLHICGMSPVCMPLPQYYSVMTVATSLDAAVTLIIPSLIIVLLNICIAIKIVNVSKQGKGADFTTSEFINRSNNEPSESNTSVTEDRCHNMVCSWRDNNGPMKTSVYLQKSQSGNARTNSVCRNQSTGLKFIRIASGRSRAQQKTARMLIIVSSVFVVLNIPSHVFRIHGFFSVSIGDGFLVPPKVVCWQELFQLIYHLNFSINFFLYSAYARQFRTGLRKLCSRLFHKLSALCECIPLVWVCSKSNGYSNHV